MTEERRSHWLNRTEKGFLAEAVAHPNTGNASVRVVKYFETDEEAVEFAAQFPKSYGLKLNRLYTGPGSGWDLALISATFRFQSNGSTGEKNETAIRRFLAFERKCQSLGIDITYSDCYANSIDRAGLNRHLT